MLTSLLDLLSRSEELFNTGNYDEAYKLLSDFENDKTHSLRDLVSIHLHKIELLFQQGQYIKLLNLANDTYKESLELGDNPFLIEVMAWKARSLIFLNQLEEAWNIIKQVDDILKNIPEEFSPRYKRTTAFFSFIKGYFYCVEMNPNKSLEYFYHSLSIREALGIKHEIAETLYWIVVVLCRHKGELTTAKKYAERSVRIAKETAKKFHIAFSLTSLAGVYTYQGDINRAISLFEESLSLFKDLNNKRMQAITLNNVGDKYRMRGDLDLALKSLEKSLKILEGLGNLRDIANVHDFLVQILIDKGDIEQAKFYLKNLEQIKMKINSKKIDQIYLLLKALILKTNLRAHNIVEAMEIFNQLLEDPDLSYESTIIILINLCELHLFELKITDDIDVLEDISPLIIKLLEIAEKSNSYWILSETYFLQAKLSLLKFDIRSAQRFLVQAQEIAEKYGIKRLAIKVSHEHDDLINQLKIWEKLKQSDASIAERIEFAGLNQQMDIMLKKRMIEVPRISEEEPVLLLIISEGGIPIFTQSFIKDKKYEEHLFGGFFTSINSFMNATFSEGLDRVSFGNYTLLMKEMSPFFICYIYKGQSYSAQNRIKLFINKLHNNKEVWDIFGEYYNMNRIIEKEEIPYLKSVIINIFRDYHITSNL